jgi:membrane protease YdiL (CAAX protease family)
VKLLHLKLNPVAVFLIILFLIVCCSVTAFYIATANKDAVGAPPPRFVIKEIYQIEPWTFQLEHYSIWLPGASFIGPVYLDDQLIGIVAQSEGGYLEDMNTRRRRPLEKFFLTLNSESYYQLKGDTLFLPLENTVLQKRISAAAQPLIWLPELYGIAYPRIFLPPAETITLYLAGGETIPSGAGSITFNNQPLIYFFGLVVLIVLLTIYLLTMDLARGTRLTRLYAASPMLGEKLAAALILFGLLIAALQGRLHNFEAAAVHTDMIILYWTIIFLLLLMHKKQFIRTQAFGLASGWRSYCRSIIIVPVILLMILLFATLQFPVGINKLATTQQLALQFLLFFSYALGVEFFWRGFLQTYLERLWGKMAGLLLVTILFTLPLFLAAYHTAGLPLLPAKAMEVFFFVPLTALILGYLYQRSQNLLSVALLHTLLLFLPGILVF